MFKPLTIVLTGGPCGGKSTAISHLRRVIANSFAEQKIDCYTLPEAPTILITGGCTYPGTSSEKSRELLEFEKGILSLQIAMEDSFFNIAKSTSRKSVLILDRCAFDLVAYMDSSLWVSTMEAMQPAASETALRSRYDAIIFLQSAANGAPEFYDRENVARTESLEEAREQDIKTRAVFESRFGDGRFHHIENTPSGFGDKLERCENTVLNLIAAHFQ